MRRRHSAAARAQGRGSRRGLTQRGREAADAKRRSPPSAARPRPPARPFLYALSAASAPSRAGAWLRSVSPAGDLFSPAAAAAAGAAAASPSPRPRGRGGDCGDRGGGGRCHRRRCRSCS